MRAAGGGALLALLVPTVSSGAGGTVVPALAATSTPAGVVGAATAAPGVQVSEDGVHFGESVATPLFDELGRLVPGDRETVTLWVRNDGELPGLLRMSGVDAWASSPEFADNIAVSAGMSGGPADAPVALRSAAECALILRGPLLEPGESAPVLVTVAFVPSASARTGAGQRARLDFVVALRDPRDPATDTADCAFGTVVPGSLGPSGPVGGAHGRDGRVADTGAAVGGAAIASALALVAGFATLGVLAFRERRRKGTP
jgi:hypothetical protein